MKQARWNILIGIILFTVLFCCSCSAPEQEQETEHTHQWMPWETVQDPTCTQEGKEERHCLSCSEIQTKSIAVLGHKLTSHPGSHTCTGISWLPYDTCSECGYSTYREIEPAHNPEYRDPNCEQCIEEYGNIDLEFTLNETQDGYIVTGLGSCTDTDIMIPGKYNSKPVIGIKKSAFWNEISLKSIIIPNGVTSISYGAFHGCTNLTSVNIPDSVTSIGDYAFDGCTSLSNVTIPDSVTSIGICAFEDCSKLIEWDDDVDVCYVDKWVIDFDHTSASVTLRDDTVGIANTEELYLRKSLRFITIPNSVKIIGTRAFEGCVHLENITIPDSVTSIDRWAFAGCTSLKSITVPDSVMSIGSEAFADCTSLTSISIPFVGATKDGNKNTHFGYLFGASDPAENDSYVPASLKTVTITGDSGIGEDAFLGCTSLTDITIQNSVTSIGCGAFRDCTSLTSITVPFVGATKNRTKNAHFGYIFGAYSAFENYDYVPASLKTVTVTQDITIGDNAFYTCARITSVTIENGLTKIGRSAFDGCTSLTTITIPNSITSIESWAFSDCTSLKAVYYGGTASDWEKISTGHTSISPLYYYSVTKPQTFGSYWRYVDGNPKIWNMVEYISNGDGTCSVSQARVEGGHFEISQYSPEGDLVTSIGEEVFHNCTSLLSITIPDSVKTIGESAFSGCASLISINIPDGVKNIDRYAFSGCTSLSSVTIPDSVTNIGYQAFTGCKNLTDITVSENNPTYKSMDGNLYSKSGNTLIQYTIGNKTSVFQIPDSVQTIGTSAFSGCTNLANITIPDSVTSIREYAFIGCTSLTSINIPDGVTCIQYSAFENCTSLESINIPNSVTSIGDSVFEGCTSLTSVSFSENCQLTSIEEYAFLGCTSLTSINIPDSVTILGYCTFSWCTSLTNITIPESVTIIGTSAFSGCTNLANITIPDSVTIIREYAFVGCTSLTSINIPNSVELIGDGAFLDCTSLIKKENGVSYVDKWVVDCDKTVTNVTLRDGTVGIVRDAFWYCTSLTSINIPDSVTILGYCTFSWCTSLTNITIPESVTSIGLSAFNNCTSLSTVYYTGTAEEWEQITIDSEGNYSLLEATVYYYSESPISDGNYWHYDGSGNPVPW